MSRNGVRQLVNVVAVVIVLAVNTLANILPLNGQTTGEISHRFQVYFVPAGYVFSIWGLIYLGLVAFAIYQALPAQGANPSLQRIGYWFAVSCLANSVWIFLWHYEVFVATIAVMLLLLASLIVIYLRAGIGRTPASAAVKWLVHIPFSLYLGWITVATIANASAVLAFLRWDGFGISAVVWAIVMLVLAAAVTSVVALTRRDVAYVLVIAWALVGIAVKDAATPTIAVAAALATVVVTLALAVGRGRQPLGGSARPS